MDKIYIVSITVADRDFVVKVYPGSDYFGYFATRQGKQYGPERSASAQSRQGTLGQQIYKAAKAAGH